MPHLACCRRVMEDVQANCSSLFSTEDLRPISTRVLPRVVMKSTWLHRRRVQMCPLYIYFVCMNLNFSCRQDWYRKKLDGIYRCPRKIFSPSYTKRREKPGKFDYVQVKYVSLQLFFIQIMQIINTQEFSFISTPEWSDDMSKARWKWSWGTRQGVERTWCREPVCCGANKMKHHYIFVYTLSPF